MSVRFHTLRFEHWIPRPIDEVFSFFSEARNLETITPPWLGFRILSSSTDRIVEGTEIRYRLSLHGFPIHWLTEIRVWDPPHRFVDVQRSGPYRMWHHTHTFEAHGDHTRMSDLLRYTLPFGPLGRLVNLLKVRNDVQTIFAYRGSQIDALFASPGALSS